VRLLPRVQFRLLDTQVPFGLRDPHSFPSPGADEIAFELSHHRQDVEQQPTDWVGRVIDRGAEAEPETEDGRGVLAGVGIDRPTTEANLAATLAAREDMTADSQSHASPIADRVAR
jgi:hypothetical protein